MRVICVMCRNFICEVPPLDNETEAGTVCTLCAYRTGEGHNDHPLEENYK